MIIGISGYIGSGKDTLAKMIQIEMYNKKGSNLPCESNLSLLSGWEIKRFAYKLKQMVSILTGIPVEDLEKQEVKDSFLEKEWNYYEYGNSPQDDLPIIRKRTVRELLQLLGTEAVRDNVHSNAWVNALFADYKQHFSPSDGKGFRGNMCNLCDKLIEDVGQYICDECLKTKGYPNWLITDCRFPNEAQAIKDKGGIVIRVDRVTQQDYDLYQLTGYPKQRHSSETSLNNWEFDYVINNSGDLDYLMEETKKMLIHFNL